MSNEVYQIITDQILKLLEQGTVQSLIKEHGFMVIGEQPFVPPKEIDRPRLAKIVRQFRELQWHYYPFNYSAYPIQHKNIPFGISGINCFGFKDHVLIRLGAKAYTQDDVSVMENNPLEPYYAQQLRSRWGKLYQLLGGKEMPSFKPPDGTMEKPV